jgi:spermidine synthase
VTGESWSEEPLYDTLRVRLAMDRVIYDSRTDHQRLVLFENARFGRVLTLDGVTQTTEADEFIYHEMLAHVPILAHGAVRRVLIIGGGDGGMLRRELMHEVVEHVTMVEIDAGVVEFSKQYLDKICGDAFDDPRLNLVIADGAEFVAGNSGGFDLIITDSTDPQGPGEVLFTETYYANCKRQLSPGGILVTQNGVPFMQPEELRSTMGILRTLFKDVTCYLATVPTYVGGPMALGWASDNPSQRQVSLDTLRQRFEASHIHTRYYTPSVHKAAFALPPYVRDLLG